MTARSFSAGPSDSTSRWTPCPPQPRRPRPAGHYPRFWIWRPPSERQWDFNPPEHVAAQRTRWNCPTPCIRTSRLYPSRFTVRTLLRSARPDTGCPGSRTRCFRACQGSPTPPGACTPCPSGVPTVAFRVLGARRHLEAPDFGAPCPALGCVCITWRNALSEKHERLQNEQTGYPSDTPIWGGHLVAAFIESSPERPQPGSGWRATANKHQASSNHRLCPHDRYRRYQRSCRSSHRMSPHQ
jgi:hypothetical protein